MNERSVERTVLPNGLTILTERMENVRSVAMGVWVRAGSRHEIAELNGISHFVEHMVFKGTETRTAQRIAREVDAIGGNLDAFTGKETICFNIKVLDEHVPTALDVLSDLVLHPIFAEGDIQRERGVIFEEIKMDEDNPDFLVHEIFTQNFWRGHPLGKPILGTKETVGRLEQAKLFGYYSDRFRGGNVVFTAAGNLDHQRFVDEVRRRFETMPGGVPEDANLPPSTSAKIVLRNKKALEQVQLCMGVPSLPISERPAILRAGAEYGAGRRHEFPAVPDGTRGTRAGVLDLQRPESLQGHGHALRLCGHFVGPGTAGDPAGDGRVPAAETGADAGGRAAAREGPAAGEHHPKYGEHRGANVQPGAAGDVLQPLLRYRRGDATGGKSDCRTGDDAGA